MGTWSPLCLSPLGRLNNRIEEGKGDDAVSRLRWPHGGCCPGCPSNKVTRRGRNPRQPACRRYPCKHWGKRFDALTGTLCRGRQQPLAVGFAYRYRRGVKLSHRPLAEALNRNDSAGQARAAAWRGGIVKRRSNVRLGGGVEGDAG